MFEHACLILLNEQVCISLMNLDDPEILFVLKYFRCKTVYLVRH